MEAPYVVRSEPGPLHRGRPPLDYRLMLRFPRLRTAAVRRVTRMPPTARLRRWLLPRAIQLAFSAYERGDYRSPIEAFYAPDMVFEAGDLTDALPVDLARTVTSPGDLVDWIASWTEAFAWHRWEVRELLDFGDALVFATHQEGAGKASGAVTDLVLFSALRFDDGMVTWQRFFREREAAISAVGRDPARVPNP